jgi:hypothetical protein
MPMFEDKNAVLRAVRSFGTTEAKGALQRPALLIAVARASEEGHIGTDDAVPIWSAFEKAKQGQLGPQDVVDSDPITKQVVGKDGSSKAKNVRHSEVRQVIAAGAVRYGNRGFADVLADARKLIVAAKQRGDYKGNTQDAFIAIARAQLKTEGRELTDDEIEAAFMPAPKQKDRRELDELKKVAKALETILKGTEPTDTSPGKEAFPSEESEAALHQLNQRISVLTTLGEVAQAKTVLLRNGVPV